MNEKILEEDFETIKSTMDKINIPIFKSGEYIREIRKNPLAFKKKISENKEYAFMIYNGFIVAHIDYNFIKLRLPHPVVPEYDMATLKLQICNEKWLTYLATKLEDLQIEDKVAVIIRADIEIEPLSGRNDIIEAEGTFYDIYKCEYNTDITVAKDFRDYYHIIDTSYFKNYETEKENKKAENNSNDNESESTGCIGCLFWIIIIIIIILYFQS